MFNSSSISAKELVLVSFGCRWPGWNWITTWKNWPIFSSYSPMYWEQSQESDIFWLVLSSRNRLIFSSRYPKSDFVQEQRLFVKHLCSFDQNITITLWQCPFKQCHQKWFLLNVCEREINLWTINVNSVERNNVVRNNRKIFALGQFLNGHYC